MIKFTEKKEEISILKEKAVFKMSDLKNTMLKTLINNKIIGSIALSTYEGISLRLFDVPINFKDFGNFLEFQTYGNANCNVKIGNDDQVVVSEKGKLTIIGIERKTKKESITIILNTLLVLV